MMIRYNEIICDTIFKNLILFYNLKLKTLGGILPTCCFRLCFVLTCVLSLAFQTLPNLIKYVGNKFLIRER